MFLNWVMLAGLGGAVIPLVVHLLARARYRSVPWAAMMFLDGVDPHQSHSARLRQWILLGIRMLLVALLAIALARPVARSRWAAWGRGGQVSAVIVLDRSGSMGYEEGGRTRFDKAREAVLRILAGLRSGDEVTLILLGEQVDVLHRDPTTNLQLVARDVAELQPSQGEADLTRGLTLARSVLDQPARANRELYLVCDHQAVSWKRLNEQWSASFLKWINDPRTPTRFYVLPVGGEENENVAVEGLDLLDPVAIRGQVTELEVRLRNFGATPCSVADLSISALWPSDPPRNPGQGRRLKSAQVTVAPMSTAKFRVPVVFEQAGSHVVSAEIRAPGLEADNRFDAVIDVIDPINVLILSGDERSEEMRRKSFFLRLALAPYQISSRRSGDAATVTVRAAEDWPKIDITRYDAIILANVPQVTADQARSLEQKVYEGGGLIICPGNLSRVENYNSQLYRGGLGLMPARLESAVAADGSRATTLLGLELTHPVFRFQRGTDPLPGAVVGRFFPAIPRAADAQVLATYASGDPFLIEGPRGRGRVLLVTTSMDADWNTLPLQPFFLPFIQSMVRYVGHPAVPSRNLLAGEAISASFDDAVDVKNISLTFGEEGIIPFSLTGRTQVVSNETGKAGVYRLQLRSGGKSRVLHFVVRRPGDESDLAPLSSGAWERYQRALGFRRLEAGGDAIARIISTDREGRELWLWCIAGVVLLGLGELYLARHWSREAA